MSAISMELLRGHYDKHFYTLVGKAAASDVFVEDHLEPFVLALPSNARVLDVGAGAGIESLLIERQGRNAFPLDISHNLLTYQESIAAKFPDNNGYLGRRVEGDIFAAPYKPESFDAAVCLNILNMGNRQERAEILQKMKELLKPKGKIFVVTEYAPESALIVGQTAFTGTEEALKEIAKNFRIPSMYYAEIEMTEDHMRELLTSAGFENVQVKKEIYSRSKWRNKQLIFSQATK